MLYVATWKLPWVWLYNYENLWMHENEGRETLMLHHLVETIYQLVEATRIWMRASSMIAVNAGSRNLAFHAFPYWLSELWSYADLTVIGKSCVTKIYLYRMHVWFCPMPHRFRSDCVKSAMIGRPHTLSPVGICRESMCLQIYQHSISQLVAFEEGPLELEYQLEQLREHDS